MDKTKNKHRVKSSFKVIGRVLQYIYKFTPVLTVLNIIFMLAVGIGSAFSIYATKLLINGIANNFDDINMFIKTLIIYILISLTIRVISSISSFIANKQQAKLNYCINQDVLNKCINLNLKDFEDSETYDSISRAKDEGQNKMYIVYNNTISLIAHVISMISIYAIILQWSSYVFLLIFIVPIVSTIINTKIGYSNYKMRMERMSEVRKISYINYLVTNDIAFKEVKIYNIGDYLSNIYKNISKKILKQDINITKKRVLWTIILGFVDEIIDFFVILKIFLLTAGGEMMIGNTVAYINSLSAIQNNMSNLLYYISEIYNDILFVNQFFHLIDKSPKDINTGKVNIDIIKEIKTKNLSFRYENSADYVLENINLTIKSNEIIGIIGENGSGKTTFIKLICGFYDDYEGYIYINGIELRTIDKNSLREKMGVIFQDYNKYELSLKENVGFGNIKEINNNEKITQVLDDVKLNKKIKNFNKGIDTQMGNWFSGEELSKGQWQKVALARAFMREGDVLILDEPTSSLDPISERDIFELLISKSRNKITIIITHRPENMDLIGAKIFLFKDGRIVAEGYHEELIHTNDEYIKIIVAKQKGENYAN